MKISILSGDEKKLDILLDIQDNPHNPTREVAANDDVSKTSILRQMMTTLMKLMKHLMLTGQNYTTFCIGSKNILNKLFPIGGSVDAVKLSSLSILLI